MANVVISGALIKVFINNKLYPVAQQVSYVIDRREKPIYGIDSSFPQEIHSTNYIIQGTISGLQTKLSGGLQGALATPLVLETHKGLYIQLKIQDRSTEENLLVIQNAKITRQTHQIVAGRSVTVSFDFIGMIAFEPLDSVT